MNDYNPAEIAEISIQKGTEKANISKKSIPFLGFLGGAFIALGYLAYIRVTGTMPHEWGSLVTLIGASVFPIGLICILLGGGELLTGNMMAVSIAYYAKKVSLTQLVTNWVLIGIFNLSWCSIYRLFSWPFCRSHRRRLPRKNNRYSTSKGR